LAKEAVRLPDSSFRPAGRAASLMDTDLAELQGDAGRGQGEGG